MPNQVPGGKADKKKPEDFDPKQIEMGIKVEMEHTDDKELAKEIAMDHLMEFPDYYTHLKDMESQLEESGKGKKASGLSEEQKGKVNALLKEYKGKEIPDSKVHALAEEMGVNTHELESYIYSLASKAVTGSIPDRLTSLAARIRLLSDR